MAVPNQCTWRQRYRDRKAAEARAKIAAVRIESVVKPLPGNRPTLADLLNMNEKKAKVPVAPVAAKAVQEPVLEPPAVAPVIEVPPAPAKLKPKRQNLI